jgi:hypothetical protein
MARWTGIRAEPAGRRRAGTLGALAALALLAGVAASPSRATIAVCGKVEASHAERSEGSRGWEQARPEILRSAPHDRPSAFANRSIAAPIAGPTVNLVAELPTATAAGAALTIPLTVTNAGPGDIGDLGFELLSFRADIALFGGLATEPEARLGRVQYPFHSRTLLFGHLAAGRTGAYALRLASPPPGVYPLKLAVDDFEGDPLGRPLRTLGGARAGVEGTLVVR